MTRVVPVDRNEPDRAVMAEAARLLAEGQLVSFPTETVYGLGGNGLDGRAAARIYAAKGRPSDNPLILHFASPEAVDGAALLNDRARLLMDALWPGPLTLVLKARPCVPEATRGGLDTVGCRMPSHPVARALLEACPFPLAAPSANTSGRPSPTDAATVAGDLGDAVAMILDGGPCDLGLESTVLDVTGDQPVLLRPGGVPLETLETLLGPVAFPVDELEKRRSPGTRYRHYAPGVPVVIWDGLTTDDLPETFSYVGLKQPPPGARKAIVFPDLAAYAHGYFAALRELETMMLPILAQWPEPGGLGRALRDRIGRSAGQS